MDLCHALIQHGVLLLKLALRSSLISILNSLPFPVWIPRPTPGGNSSADWMVTFSIAAAGVASHKTALQQLRQTLDAASADWESIPQPPCEGLDGLFGVPALPIPSYIGDYIGFRAWGLGFRIQGLRFLGFRV